jgi:hypothetical protein
MKLKNKMNTTWNIIHEKGKKVNEDNIKALRINNTVVHNQVTTANEFNDYFLNIAEEIINKITNDKKEYTCPIKNVFKYFNHPFEDISWHYTSTKEIYSIIDLLKSKNSFYNLTLSKCM